MLVLSTGKTLFQSLLCLFIAWIYLQIYFLGITSFWRRRRDEGDEKGPFIFLELVPSPLSADSHNLSYLLIFSFNACCERLHFLQTSHI